MGKIITESGYEIGDVMDVLGTLADNQFNCCVTSPPYWRLRDYGVDGQMGLEPTIDEYLSTMVGVFREVRRVLRKDGTLWLNLGDNYASGGCGVGGAFMSDREAGAWKGRNKITGWRWAFRRMGSFCDRT